MWEDAGPDKNVIIRHKCYYKTCKIHFQFPICYIVLHIIYKGNLTFNHFITARYCFFQGMPQIKETIYLNTIYIKFKQYHQKLVVCVDISLQCTILTRVHETIIKGQLVYQSLLPMMTTILRVLASVMFLREKCGRTCRIL